MIDDDRGESFLTVAEVAEWLKLNQQTVRNWIDQGLLPAVRVGRRVRIKRTDLDDLLAAGYQGGAASVAAVATGPSATDFWSGEAVGVAELDGATHDTELDGAPDDTELDRATHDTELDGAPDDTELDRATHDAAVDEAVGVAGDHEAVAVRTATSYGHDQP